MQRLSAGFGQLVLDVLHRSEDQQKEAKASAADELDKTATPKQILKFEKEFNTSNSYCFLV